MSARSRTIAARFGVGVAALVVTSCTSPSNPGTLARADQVDSGAAERATTEVLPPVTTASPPTTTAPILATTSPELTPADSSGTTDQPRPSNLEVIRERLLATLGPTNDLGKTMRSAVPFPGGVMTPAGADIFEVSVGTGSPTGDGTGIAQVGVSLTTSLDTSAALDQMTSALQAAGMTIIDSTSAGDIQSAAFRVPSVNLFDEVVVTVAPNPAGSSMRFTSNSNLAPDQLQWFVDWADEPLLFPDGAGQQTLVVISAGGSGRLEVVNLTVETVAVVESGDPQRESNRFIARLQESDRIGFAGDPGIDQPLNGFLTFDELDSLEYSVVPAIRVEVDRDGEPAPTDVVEIRLRGTLRLNE
jgi:hypothetical protein